MTRLFKRLVHWISRPPRWLVTGLAHLARGIGVLWATLVIYFSNLPWYWGRIALAAAFALFCIYSLWIARKPRLRWVVGGAFVAVLVWFILIPPSHDRLWRGDLAVMPRAVIDGDRVHITGYRNFSYRARNDFDEHWEERDVYLSRIRSVDFIISYWQMGPVAHTFLSFNFDGAPPVCISIEARHEEGEGFAPVASMFKQSELIYVVGTERDLIRSRTNYRDEEVFIYPLNVSPEAARRLFLVYLQRINELYDRPEWYHLLKNNCSINIVRYANQAGRVGRWHIAHLLNGWFDQYLFRGGLTYQGLPFDELRARSRITDVARASADDDTFSTVIRAGLPGNEQQARPLKP